MVGYLFGGNTGQSYEQLQRRRQLVDRLAAQIMGKTPKTAMEGVGAIISGIGVGLGRHRIDKEMEEGRANATAGYNDLASGLFNNIIGPGGAELGLSGSYVNPNANSSVPASADAGNWSGNDIYSGFIDTVKGNGLTNPYGLSAVAATGRAESGFSPQNANRSWSDPSESGQAGMAGGIMSWRGPRLQALYDYASSKGERPGSISPQTQAEFFMREDPQLVGKLNNARSIEEAQALMNGAWKFAGYNRPGGEAARRLSYASSFLPEFQGAGTEVASLDPGVGMPPAAAAINQQAPGSGYVDPMVSAPNYRPDTPPQGAQANMLPPLPAGRDVGPAPGMNAPQPQQMAQQPGGMMPVLMGEQPQGGQQVAQGDFPPAPAPASQFSGGINPRILQALSDPYLDDNQKAVLRMGLQQRLEQQQAAQQEQRYRARQAYEVQMKRSDPAYQLDMDYKRAQIDAAQRKGSNLINAGGGNIYDPANDRWISPPSQTGGSGAFRFGGNSVEAQALNGLMASGQLTPEQAQQLGAGKTITGPNGEIIFMTPQGVFGQQAGQPLQPMTGSSQQGGEIDIFAGSPQGAPMPQAMPASPPPAASSGMIPLTAPKVTVDERKAAGFSDRMVQSGALIDKFGDAGLNVFDQTVTSSPWVPGFIGNNLVGEDFQKFDQARRDFINAQLRRESGAVISPEEFDNANKQYFPQPGDGPDVLEQKRRNRQIVTEAMTRDAGPTYQNPAAGPLAEAQKAIAAGADRNAVIQRLLENGIDPKGL